jgi:DNA-binding FrmR family transcriptional regulator
MLPQHPIVAARGVSPEAKICCLIRISQPDSRRLFIFYEVRMTTYSPEIKADLSKRLGRIEGQVRGLSRMIAEDRDCREVVQQFTAVRSALQSASLNFMRTYICDCLEQDQSALPNQGADIIVELIDLLGKSS